MDRGQAARPRKPDSGHSDTISTTVRLCRPTGTPWNPGSIASGRRPRSTDTAVAVRPVSCTYGCGGRDVRV